MGKRMEIADTFTGATATHNSPVAVSFGALDLQADFPVTVLLGSEKAMDLIGSQDGYEAVLILLDRSIVKTDGAVFKEN